MKAWLVQDETKCDYSTIVFAETRGKAKIIAQSTDACEDSEFVDIRALRAPTFDKYYRGRPEMNWLDPDDRVAMVRDGNFECSMEVDTSEEKCAACPAHEWCGRYEREHDE